MLSLLKIKNIALIDELEIEFGSGLNLLTGETGSGKSIIVDSLGALTGERVSSDLIKDDADKALIEGLFAIRPSPQITALFDESGIDVNDSELIVRRELSRSGKNRVFINDQLVTAAFLKNIGSLLVDIHGQGEQASLFEPESHLSMLDDFAATLELRKIVAEAFGAWTQTRDELDALKRDEAEKLQLVDILRFQSDEISKAGLKPGESVELEEEKRQQNNIEKLSTLGTEAFSLLYEADGSTVETLGRVARLIEELAEYESQFTEYVDSLRSAHAVIDDLAIAIRDFRGRLEFSPDRLAEVEDRLAEITRVSRKYGGTVETAIEHLADATRRLENIETAELREKELLAELAERRSRYVEVAQKLSDKRHAAAKAFAKAVETSLRDVALDKSKFEVKIDSPMMDSEPENRFTAGGFDRAEFYFSANAGESPKPLAKVASGGEASRLMLILKTAARTSAGAMTAVFDEIDAGIGGRVAEAVGLKLKDLAATQQVLCVTHQAQVASKADRHFVVEKTMNKSRTRIWISELDPTKRIEEIARMLAGERITEAARENAREMLATAAKAK